MNNLKVLVLTTLKLSINKEARNQIAALCMNKEEVFQPWAVRYHHNHPDKTVGVSKAITVGPHMLLPVPRPQKTPR